MVTENIGSLPAFYSTIKQEQIFIFSNNSHLPNTNFPYVKIMPLSLLKHIAQLF